MNRNNFTCNFCSKVTKGGASRMKEHLAGGFTNVLACQKCPDHIRKEARDYMKQKQQMKESIQMVSRMQDFDDYHGDEEEEDCVEVTGKRGEGSSKQPPRKKPKQKRPIDMFFTPKLEDALKGRKDGKGGKQQTINDVCRKELRAKACREIAKWFYDAAIPFNVATYDSFHIMVEAIGQFGPGMNPPSMYELRVPLLKKEVATIQEKMVDHKTEWAQKEVGESNVIQVITDNASAYVKAVQLLEAKRPHLYWTPCAAHCTDLMLEDIGKNILQVKSSLKKCMLANGYIYTHVAIVNMMRNFTNQRNLHRPAITRFATSFITLSQFHKQKDNLRKMVLSKEWNKSKWANDATTIKIKGYFISDTFWRNILYSLKSTGPLVKVLRMVDGEKKPAMGYIYEAMDRAKETISKSFLYKEKEYEKAFKFIDDRWQCQLHRPLHAAGHYLNPEIFYANQAGTSCEEVMTGLYACIERLVPDLSIQDKIMEELSLYQSAQGLFGFPMAIRQRKSKAPAEWWISFGSSAPNLQNFVVPVLSLTCSATRCERNWGVFQHLYTKKRNRLAQSRLNDMVYVKFNRSLNRRSKRNDKADPILLNEIDESNEWLLGTMEQNGADNIVFEGEDLTWDVVEDAAGVNEPIYSTRGALKDKGVAGSSSSRPPAQDKGVAGNGRPPVCSRKSPYTLPPEPSRLVLVDEEIEEDIGLSCDEVEEVDCELGFDED
ncbi:unnamed protein product [Lactuca virosa]|uniref:DUF659 domain-containing protein n=1 Tax=Lactuca virosa TaxID=75947 RepID=A0AAU9PAA5_9ASTR|nr:unnamed protein product [Lactuca virosa]